MTALVSFTRFWLIACHNFTTAKKYSTHDMRQAIFISFVYTDGIHVAVYAKEYHNTADSPVYLLCKHTSHSELDKKLNKREFLFETHIRLISSF